MKKHEVTVLFSGGTDCTLATAMLTEKFSKIHLITCKLRVNENPEAAKVGVERLQKRFKNVEFIHKIIDTDNIFRKLYYGSYLKDIVRYGLFVSNVCATCKLSMYTKALEYNIENDICFWASGVSRHSGVTFVDQSEFSNRLLNRLSKKYKNAYLVPAFDVERTDWMLYELGINPSRNVKLTADAHKNQPGCYFGRMYVLYGHGYFLPLYGKQKYDEISQKYFTEKEEICEGYLDAVYKRGRRLAKGDS